MSTTMAVVRLFSNLLKDKTLGPRIVPIVADEARTFGMANLFRQIGIYSPVGQLYEPEDAGSMLVLSAKRRTGSCWRRASPRPARSLRGRRRRPSYSAHGLAMLPFYIFYSMFGFQRVGDLIWAAADQRARGFLIGATAGRTTLGGEGLQHQDGSSHVIAATVPNCRAYDPAFAYELAVIFDRGARSMMEEGRDEFYYVTVANEIYAQPTMPADVAAEEILGGLYRVANHRANEACAVRLLGSGAILREAIEAARLLEADWDVASEVLSATSYSELAREAREVERRNRLDPLGPPATSHVGARLPAMRPSSLPRTMCAPIRSSSPPMSGAVRGAGDRRLRPQRHPRRAAVVLRDRSLEHHDRRTGRAGRAWRHQESDCRRSDREIWG